MVLSPRFNLRAKAFFQMQDSWEKVQGRMMGQCTMNVHLVMQLWGVPLPGHRGSQWSPAATMNVVRAEEWLLLPNPSYWHRARLSKDLLSPQQVITNWAVQGSYLNMPAQLCRKLFFFDIFDSCFASEQIYGHARRKQSLVLLPLQCLWEEKSTWVLLKPSPDCSKPEKVRFTEVWVIQTHQLWPSKHNTAWAILCVLGPEVDLKVEGDSQSQRVQVSTATFLIGVTPIINKIWKTKISQFPTSKHSYNEHFICYLLVFSPMFNLYSCNYTLCKILYSVFTYHYIMLWHNQHN